MICVCTSLISRLETSLNNEGITDVRLDGGLEFPKSWDFRSDVEHRQTSDRLKGGGLGILDCTLELLETSLTFDSARTLVRFTVFERFHGNEYGELWCNRSMDAKFVGRAVF